MSISKRFSIFLGKGLLWSKSRKTRDGRKGYNTLNEALDDLARKQCCGIDCCENAVYLKATNGTPVKAKIEIDGENISWVFSVVANED